MGQHKTLGFSIIELMVVIAIISVLAAIAVPQYQLYMIKNRISTVIPIIDMIVNRGIEYANIHGHFPLGTQLGYNPNPSRAYALNSIDPSQLGSPYIAWMDMNDLNDAGIYDPNAYRGCGRGAGMNIYLKQAAVGLNSPYGDVGANSAWITVLILNHNGVISKFYAYDIPTSGGDPYPGNFLPGLINIFPNGVVDWTYWGNLVTPAIASATCM